MIVQPSSYHVAIRRDDDGNVEIRQERSWGEDADTVITIDRRNAGLAARAILNAAGMFDVEFYRQRPSGLCYDYDPENPEGLEPEERDDVADDEEPQSPKDPTGAERQRRYRKRKREGTVTQCPRDYVDTVTPDRNVTRDARDTVTEEPELTLVAAE